MVVLILERVPAALRGELTRWMLEPKTGVFVGRVSAMVRDLLWEKVCKAARGGGCTMIHTANREQGFAIRLHGDPSRQVEDFEGLFLIRVP
jgi:CRISPR-associated protein Cas2